ncbi:hypothetical protein EYF80_063477 [Liparis tanakae]|uniref:Uncharacterized protein n=1 Tax=Liparis tanakae TaxID=230148 RepID=A0A4Z2ECC6_9TELE|nr:hypothetical protein EYF80_063477 [Liparis tanakae]
MQSSSEEEQVPERDFLQSALEHASDAGSDIDRSGRLLTHTCTPLQPCTLLQPCTPLQPCTLLQPCTPLQPCTLLQPCTPLQSAGRSAPLHD